MPCFSSWEAAAALWVARRVDLLWGLGLQLPLLRGFLPGTGSKPGQLGFLRAGFFAVAMVCQRLIATSSWRVDGVSMVGKERDLAES